MRTFGVVLEGRENETRVSLVPEVVRALIKGGNCSVKVESGAGLKAGFSDPEYESAGAQIASNRQELLNDSHTLLTINGADLAGDPLIKGKIIIGLFDPFFNQDAMKSMSKAGATLLALELIPRISRAQSMDVLSSQANIAGYIAVIKSAEKLGKIMPMMMTAAGTIKPARVLVIGAGVAGLAAIACAKRLGSMVFAYDVRDVVKEQVESLGAKFLEIKIEEGGEGSGGYAKALSDESLNKQRAKLTDQTKEMDVVITTAQIPGRKAPRLLDDNVFEKMKRGSVIIDMAAASGGNVAGSVVDTWQEKNGVSLYGGHHLSCFAPKDASFTFAKNIQALLKHMESLGEELDLNDEILSDSIICHQGEWVSKLFSSNIEKP